MNRRIIEARKIYSKAIEEFERGMMYNDRIIIRDSAEKAWLSAVKAIDALIDSEGYEIPFGAGAHEFRNTVLSNWGEEDTEIRRLYDDFILIRERLHGNCFYYGICHKNQTEEEINKVKGFIDKIENILDGGR
ncbi:MAG: hypothetical protein ACE5J3_03175 [Methanosarcinales archaeon]